MNITNNPKDREIWERMASGWEALLAARNDFLRKGVDRVALVRQALDPDSDYRDEITAGFVLEYLSEDELKAIFGQLILWASWQNAINEDAEKAILRLPKEWLVENVEAIVEPYLQVGEPFTRNNYWYFLHLYQVIDPDLNKKLVLRALKHDDEEIRLVGQQYIGKHNTEK